MATDPSTIRPTRVATIVLNYEHVEDTVRCVHALQQGTFRDHRIIVVDNAEDGPTTAALRERLGPEVVVFATGDNLGYAGGNNYGIRAVLPSQPEFVWLVNPDTVAKPNTLAGLVQAAEAHPDAGIVGCRMLVGGSKPARIESNGGVVDAERFGASPKRDAGCFDREITDVGVHDVDWVSGACMLIRAGVIDDVGLLSEEYFLYYEDTDYCLCTRASGWRVVVAQGTRMWHFRRSAGELPTAAYVYYLCRSRILFGIRHFNASVDDVLTHVVFPQRQRARVELHAPASLDTFDHLVRTAVDDARAGRFGRVEAVESMAFVPSSGNGQREVERLTEVLRQERKRASRDAKRLLRRIDEVAGGKAVPPMTRELERERRRRARVEREIQALRGSRSFRIGRAITRLARPIATIRAKLAASRDAP